VSEFGFQPAELLEHEIATGRLAPGDRVPSEPELCRRFGVSRTTVRQALGRLNQRGLIERHPSFGTRLNHTPRSRSYRRQSNASP
jgi:DNA-binding GntR family transcriptional regulator